MEGRETRVKCVIRCSQFCLEHPGGARCRALDGKAINLDTQIGLFRECWVGCRCTLERLVTYTDQQLCDDIESAVGVRLTSHMPAPPALRRAAVSLFIQGGLGDLTSPAAERIRTALNDLENHGQFRFSE